MTTPFSVFSAHAAGAAGVGEADGVATADVVDISGAIPSMKESLPSLLSPEKDDDTAHPVAPRTTTAAVIAPPMISGRRERRGVAVIRGEGDPSREDGAAAEAFAAEVGAGAGLGAAGVFATAPRTGAPFALFPG
ncbi:UNVERIFIED_ORG: hypothetical protein M2328_006835 [Rhodococcus erythropolis]